VAQLIHDLGVSPDTAALVPEGLTHLVQALMAARAEATS
jgi:hypothetical protein